MTPTRYFLAALLSLPAMAHAGEPALKKKLDVIRRIPHSGYSEGLDFHQGYLWGSLPKEIVKIDPADGTVLKRFPPASDYNESPAWFGGKLWVLSYSDSGIYEGTLEGDKMTYVRKGTTPEEHGWGITQDGKHIIISGNYSNKIYFLDPKDFHVVKKLETNVHDIEDLAWDGTGVWASSYTHYRGSIFHIDAVTGQVTTLYEFPNPDECPIIDGMALDGKTLWVTGKNCPSILNVKLPKIAPREIAATLKK